MHGKLVPVTIHDRIRQLRLARGMSVSALAREVTKRTPDDPVSRQRVQNWEKNAGPKRKQLAHVAEILGTNLEGLLGDETPPAIADPADLYGQAFAQLLRRFETKERRALAFAKAVGVLEKLLTAPETPPVPASKPFVGSKPARPKSRPPRRV